jgi:hypothetical protein
MRLGFAAANAFAWIFIFQYFSMFDNVHVALARTAFLFALVYTISCLVTPYAAGRLRNGMKKGIVFGVVIACAAFVLLGASFQGLFGQWYIVGIVAFAILLGVYRALYWVPYTVESHDLQTPARPNVFRNEIIIAVLPALAGIALTWRMLAPAWLLFIAGAYIILSLVPLARVPDVYERFSWKYRETFAELFARRRRHMLLRAICDGMQSTALFLLWPIAIFLIVGSSYLRMGTVLSLAFLLALALRRPMRMFMHRVHIHDVSLFYATVAASAWIGRVLVASPFTIVFVDTYFHIGTAGREGMDMLSLEQSADGGSYLDEYTALKEIGLGFGRILMSVIAAILSLTFSISISLLVSFLIAAIAAGISMWIVHRSVSHERI